MNPLKQYLMQFDTASRHEFAERCGTSLAQLQQIYDGYRPCNPILAIEIDKHSGGEVKCDDLCHKADFEYIRKKALKEAVVYQ